MLVLFYWEMNSEEAQQLKQYSTPKRNTSPVKVCVTPTSRKERILQRLSGQAGENLEAGCENGEGLSGLCQYRTNQTVKTQNESENNCLEANSKNETHAITVDDLSRENVGLEQRSSVILRNNEGPGDVVGYPVASTPTLDVEDQSSNDSTSLQIIVPVSGQKRRRSEEQQVYDIDRDIESDIQTELDKKAKKTNLTVKNVKSILRYVIGNESVLAMVRSSMKDAGAKGGLEYDPALTRSKARQLREKKHILWPLSPVRPPPPDEHHVLIREELPDEEDDDEYRPTPEDLLEHSDDESGRLSLSSSLNSSTVGHYLETFDPGLLDGTAPPTPEDSAFKRPLGKGPESIGQRTRSKLSLSSTPLEAIEQAFVPPDITTDMYDFKCDDRDWENFLREFMQPLPENCTDADEDDDPEYNVLGEEETLDKEELRRDRGVHVSRAELKTLMLELLQDPDAAGSSDEDPDPAPQPVKEVASADMEERIPTPEPEPELEVIGMTSSQRLLLQQHLRQHVQLLTQHFLQTHRHPLFSKHAQSSKVMLAELMELVKLRSESALNVYNLPRAFALVELWEKLLASPRGQRIVDHYESEHRQAVDKKRRRLKHVGAFTPELLYVLAHSDVFLYPRLLPPTPFRYGEITKLEFLESEDNLIALGLEQFVPHIEKYPRWCDKRIGAVNGACDLIHKYLLPCKSSKQLLTRVRNLRTMSGNPINQYHMTRRAPSVVHHVVPCNSAFLKPPIDQVVQLLPPVWREYVENLRKAKKKS